MSSVGEPTKPRSHACASLVTSVSVTSTSMSCELGERGAQVGEGCGVRGASVPVLAPATNPKSEAPRPKEVQLASAQVSEIAPP